MVRINTKEGREDIVVRFLANLNHKIAIQIELQHYVELEDMAHMAIKVTKQLMRRGTRQNCFADQNIWRLAYPKEDKVKANPKEAKTANPKAKSKPSTSDDSMCKRDIKCFKC